MKWFKWIFGSVIAASLIIVLFISAFELAVYSDMDFFRNEYEKYQVLDNVNMKMDDLMDVTKEMMKYLHGNRSDLIVQTTVGGEERLFFNEREMAHMKDVQELFLSAIRLRYICLGFILLSLILLIVIKTNWKFVLARSLQIGIVLFAILTGILVFVISRDFNAAFIRFHEIFFHNDLWLLDPSTDLLINILPEQFFVDTAVRITVIFVLCLVVVFGISFLYDHFVYSKRINKHISYNNKND